jgi:hypothetical protein
MRDQGFSYRVIAEALRVSGNTVQRDVSGVRQSTPDPVMTTSPVLESTPEVVMTSEVETNFTPEPVITESPVLESTPDPVKRGKGRDQKSYPSQRPRRERPAPKYEPAFTKVLELGMTVLGICDTPDKLDRLQHVVQELQAAVERCRLEMEGAPATE